MDGLELIKLTSDSANRGCGPSCNPSGCPPADDPGCKPDRAPCVPN